MFHAEGTRVALIFVEQGVSPLSPRIFRLSGRWGVRTFSLEHFAAYWTECGIFWWDWRTRLLSLCRWTYRKKISFIYCWLLFYGKQQDRIHIFFFEWFCANSSLEKIIAEDYSKTLTCIQGTVSLHRSRTARSCNVALWRTLLERTDRDRIF